MTSAPPLWFRHSPGLDLAGLDTPDDTPDLAHTDPPAGGGGDDDGGGDGGGGGGWVTLAKFWSPTEAHLAKITLEREDVPVVLMDENFSNTQLFAIASGGVKLLVPRDRASFARRLLNLGPVDETALAALAEGSAPEDVGGGGTHWGNYLVLPLVLSPLLLPAVLGQPQLGLAAYLLGNVVGALYLVTRS